MTPTTDWIPLLAAIADEADAIALRHFRRFSLRVDLKPDASPVSEADRAIEALARRLVAARYPGLGILGEEEGETGSRDARLILDPIDGTRNFVRGIPVFATLLAIELEGDVVAGLVSAPALHRRWHAARGAGAWSGAWSPRSRAPIRSACTIGCCAPASGARNAMSIGRRARAVRPVSRYASRWRAFASGGPGVGSFVTTQIWRRASIARPPPTSSTPCFVAISRAGTWRAAWRT